MPPIVLGGHRQMIVINPEVYVCFVAWREIIQSVFNPTNPYVRQKSRPVTTSSNQPLRK